VRKARRVKRCQFLRQILCSYKEADRSRKGSAVKLP